MADHGRRGFLRNLLREGVKTVAQVEEGWQQGRREADDLAFFESYESSYAFSLAEEELVLETASQEGIPVEGREKKDIARDLFMKKQRA